MDQYEAPAAVLPERHHCAPGGDRAGSTGIQWAVAEVRSHLPVVGYEAGASLEAARQAGFHALGPLRIWARSSPHRNEHQISYCSTAATPPAPYAS